MHMMSHCSDYIPVIRARTLASARIPAKRNGDGRSRKRLNVYAVARFLEGALTARAMRLTTSFPHCSVTELVIRTSRRIKSSAPSMKRRSRRTPR